MANSLEQEIQNRLAQYLRGDETLAEFEAWLLPASWDLSPQADPAGHELATAILMRIGEFTGGDWTESELRLHLEALQAAQVEIIYSASENLVTGSPAESSPSLADTSLTAEFA